MAKSATITLTTAGADTGPFNLLSNVDSYTTPFETNIPKASLVGGYTSTVIPDAATVIRVLSASGRCINSYVDLPYPATTTTTTTTTTSTTTTTTTLPPLVITNGTVTCSGNTGDFTSTMTGGTGTYNFVAIDTSQANVATLIATGTSPSGQGVRVTPNGIGTHNWTSIANGTWYTAVQDSNGTNSVQNNGVVINCTTTTTTTTSTTTTTTTVPVYNYCLGYDVSDCCAAKSDYDINCGPPP